MKYVYDFVGFINESAREARIVEGTEEEVVFFPGRFQPFHKGHLAALKKTADTFGKKVVALQIVSAREESPFPDSLLQKMAKDVVRNNPFIEDFVIYPQGYGKTVIPWFVRYLRDQGYEPIGLGAGIDRMKDYQNQVKYITGPKSDTPVYPNFEVRLVDTRDGDGPSGTKVRQALKDDDRAVFNSLMPAELHKYYEELKKYLDK
jgi:cytidyltransferase-like protein